jgi:hypothetical protein
MNWIIPPAGVTPASFWDAPEPIPSAPPVSYLAEELAPDNKTYPNGVRVRRAEVLSTVRGMDPTDAAVLAAMLVRRGSGPAVRDMGHRFDRITLAQPSTAEEIRSEVLLALERLISANDIVDVEIVPSIDPRAEQGSLEILYTNNRTGQSGIRVAIPI